MQGYRWLAIATATALTACSAANGAATLPQTSSARGLAFNDVGEVGVWGQVLHAIPSALAITSCQTGPASFDAVENFRGDVVAVPEDRQLVTVSPAEQRNDVYVGEGGLKHAVFNVSPLGAAGTTRIAVTDKKGNVDYVTVTVVSCVSAPPACASSSARRVDGKRRVNSGTIAVC